MTGALHRASSREFAGTIEAAEDAEAWLVSQSGRLGLAENTRFAINLCLEELFLNAVQHGRANRATVSLWTEADGVRVEFVDDGRAFDPTVVHSKRISGPSEDFTIGGYGTGLVQKFSKRMSYRRTEGRNCLLLEFGADSGATAG